MQLRKSERKKAFMKLNLQGPSGSGKTMSALLLAYGLTGNWEKIAIIDTENGSADLYAHLGPFKVLSLKPNFTPERYIKAIEVCEQAQIEVIIIDSISHEWEGPGGILDSHAQMTGNSFMNWSKLTPRHNAFVQKMLQSDCHIIGTIRSKQDYVITEKNGKQVPQKVGLKGVTREGLDYEFTLVFELNLKHFAKATKDRTGLFMDHPEFQITADTGIKIKDWCALGIGKKEVRALIINCQSKEELKDLYFKYHGRYPDLVPLMRDQKIKFAKQHSSLNTLSKNGITNLK